MIKTETGCLAIAATFTSEPIERAISYWLNQLGFSWSIAFAPYNQVFQQLLDPTSVVTRNQAGANIILVRFEDWVHQHDHQHDDSQEAENHDDSDSLQEAVQHFAKSLIAEADQSPVPHLVCICPPSPQAISTQSILFDKLTTRLVETVSGHSNIHLITWQEVQDKYAVEEYYDPQGDRLGRVPYTEAFFIALASTIARKLFVINQRPYKVIVLDCDQTLWGGVIGEDGSDGIEIGPERKWFHELLIDQHNAGMLLCLCSKNREADVLQAFEQRSDMSLKLEHLVSWRINWQPKSQNLRELADELQLGLDSFIFIDDNPVECAEVQANCPEVATIQFPIDKEEIAAVAKHIWAFDRLSVTAEDKDRTQMYRQNVARAKAQTNAPTLKEFLDSLALQITCVPMRHDQLPRVSQLTQRTNQFNASTVRRSESEIQTLCANEGYECLTIEVSDRFGDYGLVGVVIYTMTSETLIVDTFLLSCRVLGRGVEHNIIEHLAQVAQNQELTHLSINYIQTKRNEPVWNFLEQIGSEFKSETGTGTSTIYKMPVAAARSCSSFLHQATPEVPEVENSTSTETGLTSQSSADSTNIPEPPITGSDASSTVSLISRIALALNSAAKIKAALDTQTQPRPKIDEPFVPPQTALEKSIATIWAKVLYLSEVGLNDKFTEIGGGSLQLVQVHSQLARLLKADISVMQLFTLPTIKSIAYYIDIQQRDTQQSADTKQHAIKERADRQVAAMQRHKIPRVKV